MPSEEHSLVIRRLLEPKAEQPESAKYCRTGVGTGSGGTEIASMVDPLKDFKVLCCMSRKTIHVIQGPLKVVY